jgi:hypothetical protein
MYRIDAFASNEVTGKVEVMAITRRGRLMAYALTLISVVTGVFVLANPALAATSLGGFHQVGCTAFSNCELSIYTDSLGNFDIGISNNDPTSASSCSSSQYNWCEMGRGYAHRVLASNHGYNMYIRDTKCDNRGPTLVLNYFVVGAHTLNSTGCNNDTYYPWTNDATGVNFRVEFAGGGITFNTPTTVNNGTWPSSAHVFPRA